MWRCPFCFVVSKSRDCAHVTGWTGGRLDAEQPTLPTLHDGIEHESCDDFMFDFSVYYLAVVSFVVSSWSRQIFCCIARLTSRVEYWKGPQKLGCFCRRMLQGKVMTNWIHGTCHLGTFVVVGQQRALDRCREDASTFCGIVQDTSPTRMTTKVHNATIATV